MFSFHSNKLTTTKPKIEVSPLCGLICKLKQLLSFRTIKGIGQVRLYLQGVILVPTRPLLSEMTFIEMPQEFGSVKNALTEHLCVRHYV